MVKLKRRMTVVWDGRERSEHRGNGKVYSVASIKHARKMLIKKNRTVCILKAKTFHFVSIFLFVCFFPMRTWFICAVIEFICGFIFHMIWFYALCCLRFPTRQSFGEAWAPHLFVYLNPNSTLGCTILFGSTST